MTMDWGVVLWTSISWMFSGGVLYLVYDLGRKNAREGGIKRQSWATVILLLTYTIAIMFFGFNSVPSSLQTGFNREEASILLGILLVIFMTYAAAFFDTRRQVAVPTTLGDKAL
jgi:hypothetical protein